MKRHWLDALGCVLGVLYGVPSLVYPFGADQGVHWYLGYGWLQGHMPYATGISGKPPGIFLVHALASALFGDGQSAIRWFELVSLPLLGFLVASAARLPGQPLRAGAWGAATLLVAVANYTYADYWNTAHPENWEALCLLAAFHVATQVTHNRRRALFAGALCTMAFVLKYPAAAVAIPIAALCGLRAWREHPSRRVVAFAQATAFYLVGVALVLGVTLLPFVVSGTVTQMLEVCVDMTVRYASGAQATSDWWPGFWKWSRGGTLLLWSGACAGIGAWWAMRRRDRASALHVAIVCVLLLAAVWGVALQGRNWSYHWVSVFPFLVVLGLWGMQQALRRDLVVLAVAIGSALTAFLIAPRFVAKAPRDYRAHVTRWFDYVGGQASLETLQSEFERLGRFDRYGVQLRVATFAKRHAAPEDTLCVRGFLSPIYQASGMRCTSRHAIQAFVGLGPPSWKREYKQDMQTRPPTFVVTFDDRSQDLRALAKQGYVEIYREDGLVLLRRS